MLMKKSILHFIFLILPLTPFAQNLNGYFSGINKQELGYEYPVEILIENNGSTLKGSINYSSLNCFGELVYVGKTYDHRFYFKENLKTVNTCVSGGSVVLEALNDDLIVFYWYYSDGRLGSATVR